MENVNLRAAAIHVIGDMIQSVGVLIASIIIYFYPEWRVIDPICTLIFAVIVMFTTITVSKDCIGVLMEGVPAEVDMAKLESDIMNVKGVISVHDIHVWALSMGKKALSAHLIADDHHSTLKRVTKICHEKYKIYHTTV